jgi:hypothetical protein
MSKWQLGSQFVDSHPVAKREIAQRIAQQSAKQGFTDIMGNTSPFAWNSAFRPNDIESPIQADFPQ